MGGTGNSSAYQQANPTPGAVNVCPAKRHQATSSSARSMAAAATPAPRTTTTTSSCTTAASHTVDLSGWSVQYASAAGSGWSSNLQPLGGTIGAGEVLPDRARLGRRTGRTAARREHHRQINMSGTSGKVALSDSFEPLTGNCPLANAHVRDFIGYGSADCGEGATTAPGLTNTSADIPSGERQHRHQREPRRLRGGHTESPSNRSHRRDRALRADHRIRG